MSLSLAVFRRKPTHAAATRWLSLARAVLLWPARAIAARHAMRQLCAMSDAELKDIGLYRQDLRDASALDLGADPTQFLARRVRERRPLP